MIFLFPGGGGRDERSLIRFRDQSPSTLNFEVVRIGEWRDWIEQDLDFDQLAARACRHIETLSAEGPVRVAGYSQGGQLAYACALALERGTSCGVRRPIGQRRATPFGTSSSEGGGVGAS